MLWCLALLRITLILHLCRRLLLLLLWLLWLGWLLLNLWLRLRLCLRSRLRGRLRPSWGIVRELDGTGLGFRWTHGHTRAAGWLLLL